MTTTKDYAKIGTIGYRVSIGDNTEEVAVRLFDDLEAGKEWGRECLVKGTGTDVMIERQRYVAAEPWDDEEYGTIWDADIETDDEWRMYLFSADADWREETDPPSEPFQAEWPSGMNINLPDPAVMAAALLRDPEHLRRKVEHMRSLPVHPLRTARIAVLEARIKELESTG